MEDHSQKMEALFVLIYVHGFHVRIEECIHDVQDTEPKRDHHREEVNALRFGEAPSKDRAATAKRRTSAHGQLLRLFMKEIRQIQAPFDALLKENVPFKWAYYCHDAFEKSKRVLSYCSLTSFRTWNSQLLLMPPITVLEQS